MVGVLLVTRRQYYTTSSPEHGPTVYTVGVGDSTLDCIFSWKQVKLKCSHYCQHLFISNESLVIGDAGVGAVLCSWDVQSVATQTCPGPSGWLFCKPSPRGRTIETSNQSGHLEVAVYVLKNNFVPFACFWKCQTCHWDQQCERPIESSYRMSSVHSLSGPLPPFPLLRLCWGASILRRRQKATCQCIMPSKMNHTLSARQPANDCSLLRQTTARAGLPYESLVDCFWTENGH